MQITNDHYLVLVEQYLESYKTPSGIITQNTAVIDEDSENRTEHKRRYGTVLELPHNFTNNDVGMIDPGMPHPRRFIGHEWIQMMRNAGHRKMVRMGEIQVYVPYDEESYYPSTFERYETISCRDVARLVDVKAGEKVYFTENATEQERYMGAYKGGFLYSVRVDEIQAVVRNVNVGIPGLKPQKRIIMQGGWVLVRVDMETWEEISIPIPGQDVPLVVKAAPEAKPLRGWIEGVSHRADLKRGDHIIFERDADAPCTVEGKECTIMKDEDILAKIKPKK